jgi:hypothetical protein
MDVMQAKTLQQIQQISYIVPSCNCWADVRKLALPPNRAKPSRRFMGSRGERCDDFPHSVAKGITMSIRFSKLTRIINR